DKVARGELDARTFLDAVWQKLEPLLAKWHVERGAGLSAVNSAGDPLICPVCHLGNLQQRTSRKGEAFYSCSAYPNCNYSRNVADDPQFTGQQCPNCSSELLIKARRDGGTFVACSNFPTCRYSQSVHT
ncbi:MAG: topoisomerase DNA-binding C4 zinc finger domain-containing protein, partial [Phototrophicaceae bacterium]